MLSVANHCDYNENSKNGKNCLQTNAHPSGPTSKISPPPPGQKLGCKKPRVGANFRCKYPWGTRGGGGGLWQKLIAASGKFGLSVFPRQTCAVMPNLHNNVSMEFLLVKAFNWSLAMNGILELIQFTRFENGFIA